MMGKRLIITALIALFVFSVEAQDVISSSNQTTSPYSRYGYGVLSDKGIGASRGMGGISYGIRNQNVNPGNPASYSGVDSLTFIFDIGISYSNAKLSEPGASQKDDNGGLDFLALQFPIGKKIGVSAGFLPYSSVGYSFGTIETIGETSYQKYFSGTGGLNQIYGGFAYKPVNSLSFGVNVSYLYGTITHNRSLPLFTNNSDVFTSYDYRKFTINAAKFDLGLQFQTQLDKKRLLTVGVVYTPQINPQTRLKGENIIPSLGDTTSIVQNYGVKFPHTFGLGFSVSSKKLLFGADATFQKWKDLEYPSLMGDELSTTDRFNNRWRFNAGMEYSINPNDRSFVKKMKFRGGVNYSNSYLNVKNHSDGNIGGYKEYGATLGFGLPFKDTYTGRVSYINIAFEYTKLNPEFKTMIKEEYFGVSLNVNLSDMWFMKNKFK